MKIISKNGNAYTYPSITCKKIIYEYGFKAMTLNMQSTQSHSTDSKRPAIQFSMNKTITEPSGKLEPHEQGLHLCELFSDVILSYRPDNKISQQTKESQKYRYFFCKTGDICITEHDIFRKDTCFVTNELTPLFEIDMTKFKGNHKNKEELNKFAKQQIVEYFTEKNIDNITDKDIEITNFI